MLGFSTWLVRAALVFSQSDEAQLSMPIDGDITIDEHLRSLTKKGTLSLKTSTFQLNSNMLALVIISILART
jgi:hypothetical protein